MAGPETRPLPSVPIALLTAPWGSILLDYRARRRPPCSAPVVLLTGRLEEQHGQPSSSTGRQEQGRSRRRPRSVVDPGYRHEFIEADDESVAVASAVPESWEGP